MKRPALRIRWRIAGRDCTLININHYVKFGLSKTRIRKICRQ